MKFFITVSLIGSLAAIASASHLFVFTDENFSGDFRDVGACGCSGIPNGYRGSLKWDGTGQTGRLYNMDDCRGAAYQVLDPNQELQLQSRFGFRSLFIDC
ncbi:hypothetical protein FBU30_011038 [Linnemannia zychae]|nr:hypothetical protein FBU30_011038 [Linnemannia zychae]